MNASPLDGVINRPKRPFCGRVSTMSKIANPSTPKPAHIPYSSSKIAGSEANHDPETYAPKPIPTSNDINMVLNAVADFPSGAKSMVHAKIAGMLMPMDKAIHDARCQQDGHGSGK